MKKLAILGLLLASLSAPAFAAVDPPATAGPTALTATGMTLGITNAYRSSFVMLLTGITGTAGLQVEGTIDGTTWAALYLNKAGSATVSLTATASGTYTGNAGGFRSIRIKTHYLAAGQGVANASLSWGLPGVNAIANVAVTPVP